MDVGEFYLKHLLACVPSNRRIEMKRTVYKKFTVFLKEVNSREGGPLVRIDEKRKGAEVIVEVGF